MVDAGPRPRATGQDSGDMDEVDALAGLDDGLDVDGLTDLEDTTSIEHRNLIMTLLPPAVCQQGSRPCP